MSNDKFRGELARLDVNGKNIPVLRLVLNAISNRLRALVGLSTKPIERLDMDNIDGLTMALVNTNLDRVGDDNIAKARTPREIVDLTVEVKKATDKYKGEIAYSSWASKVNTLLVDSGKAVKTKFYELHGGQTIGDLARAAGFGSLGLQLEKAITQQRGLQMNAEAKLEKMIKREIQSRYTARKEMITQSIMIYKRKYGATLYQE